MIYLVLFIISFATVFLLTPVVRNLAIRNNLYDHPGDDNLKIHGVRIPRIGGIAIFSGVSLSLLIGVSLTGEQSLKVFGLMISGGIIAAIGLWDDLKPLSPFIRLMVQIIAAAILVGMGVNINGILPDIPAMIVSIMCIVFLVNSVNLMDGMDGLVAGVSFISAIGFFILSLMISNQLGSLLAIALAGATLGFLPYNFNPASIFMGDIGSTFLGFILATLAVISLQQHSVLWVVVLMIVGLPVFDTSVTIIRRLKKRQSIFIGDRDHTYDKLMQRGFSQKRVALLFYLIALAMSLFGISLTYIIIQGR